jgi:hypothetical protein
VSEEEILMVHLHVIFGKRKVVISNNVNLEIVYLVYILKEEVQMLKGIIHNQGPL